MCAAWAQSPRDPRVNCINQLASKIDVNSSCNHVFLMYPLHSLQFSEPGSVAQSLLYLISPLAQNQPHKIEAFQRCPPKADLTVSGHCRWRMTHSSTSDHLQPLRARSASCAPRVLPGLVWPDNTRASPRVPHGHKLCVTCRRRPPWTS